MVGSLIAKNLETIKHGIISAQKNSLNAHAQVTVIGVSKRQSDEIVKEGIRMGLEHLGENYVQELSHRIEDPFFSKVHWHLIGPLQTNKAKFVVGKVDFIHTVDRESLADVISRLAVEQGTLQKVLVQVNIAEEESKSGVKLSEVESLCRRLLDFKGLDVVGLMTMPPLANVAEESRVYFKKLRELRDQLNRSVFKHKKILHLSMGTSQDYGVAVEEGATFVRVGSTLFGERIK